MRHEASDGTRTMPRHGPGRQRQKRSKGSKATMDARGREYLALFARYQELDMQYARQIRRDGDRIRELEDEVGRLRAGLDLDAELERENAALREIVRVVAEADNSDSSVCYQLCRMRWYGGETDAEEMEMRHDAPCVVTKARALLSKEA